MQKMKTLLFSVLLAFATAFAFCDEPAIKTVTPKSDASTVGMAGNALAAIDKIGVNATALQGLSFIQQADIHYGTGAKAKLHFDPVFVNGVRADKEVWTNGKFGAVVSPSFLATITKAQVRDAPTLSLPMEVDKFDFAVDTSCEYHISPDFSLYGGPGIVLSYTKITTSALPPTGSFGQVSASDWTPGIEANMGMRYQIIKNLMFDASIQAQHTTGFHFPLSPVDARFSLDTITLFAGVGYIF
jgi:opacity protein-like surface antigen